VRGDLAFPDFDEPLKKLWPPLELSDVARAMLTQEGQPRVVYRGSHEGYEARVARQRQQAKQQKAYYERLERGSREAYDRAQAQRRV
jgi:hypothetical protein